MKHKKGISRLIMASATLFVLTGPPIFEAGSGLASILGTSQVLAASPKFETQTNPDLTPLNPTLGGEQKVFQSSTDTLNTDYQKFVSDSTTLNDSNLQKKVLNDMKVQLSNVSSLINSLKDYLASNPNNESYPNLVTNLQTYVEALTDYQTKLTQIQLDLQKAVGTVNAANQAAQSAYDNVATAYQKLLNTNYVNVTNNYNALMLNNNYVRRTGTYNDNAVNTGAIVQPNLKGITGYSPWNVTSKPTLALGGSKGQTATLPNPNTYNATTWDTALSTFNGALSDYQTAEASYKASLADYTNNYVQTNKVDPSLTALYSTAQSSYSSAQTTYQKAQNSYDTLASTVTANNSQGLYTVMNSSANMSYLLNQVGMLYSGAQTILGTSLTSPVNSWNSFSSSNGSATPDTLTVLSSAGISAGTSTSLTPTSAILNGTTTPKFWSGGYFGKLGTSQFPAMNSQLAAYLDSQAFSNRDKGVYYNQLINTFSTLATAIQSASDTAYSVNVGALGNPITDYLSGGRVSTAIMGTATSGANIYATGIAGSLYGYGMPIYHQTKSWMTDSLGNILKEQLVPDPIPAEMDYPSLETLNNNITKLLATGTWNGAWSTSASNNTGVLNFPITQDMISKWQNALEYIRNNVDSNFATALQPLASAWTTYNNSKHTTADQKAFNTTVDDALKKVNAAYDMVYGSNLNVDDLQNKNNIFTNDLTALDAQQLASKYGYRSLLAGMTSLIYLGYYNNIKWPSFEPGQIVYKQLLVSIGSAGHAPLLTSLGFGNQAPYLTAPVQSIPTLAPPTQPVLQNLSFDEKLIIPPDLILDYEAQFIPKLPNTGTNGNPVLLFVLGAVFLQLIGIGLLGYRKKS